MSRKYWWITLFLILGILLPAGIRAEEGYYPVGAEGGTFTCGAWLTTLSPQVSPGGALLHCGEFDPHTAPAAPGSLGSLNKVSNFNLYDAHKQWMVGLGAPLTLCYTYTMDDLVRADYDPTRFVVLTAPIGGTWQTLDARVDTERQQVCADLPNLMTTLVELAVQPAAATPVVPPWLVPGPAAPTAPLYTGSAYTIRYGDTLFSIARRSGVTVTVLKSVNQLTSNLIYPGQILTIPATTTPIPTPPPAPPVAVQPVIPFTPVSPSPVAPVTPPALVATLPFYNAIGEVEAGPADRPRIALTFDSGVSSPNVATILDILRDHQVKTTIFVTGQWANNNPELLQRIAAEGHEIGNHSYSHPDFTRQSDAAILSELQRTEEIVQRIAGVSPRPFFRAPYGARNAHTNALVAAQGYYPIYWTLDSGDWQNTTPEKVLAKVVSQTHNGSIVVSHLSSAQTAQVLAAMIQQLRAQGLELVPLSQLLLQ